MPRIGLRTLTAGLLVLLLAGPATVGLPRQVTQADLDKLYELLETGAHYKVRFQAAKALGLMKMPAAVPNLLKALNNDDDPLVRGTAAWALGSIGHPGAVDALVRAIEKDEEFVSQQADGARELIVARFPDNLPGPEHAFYHLRLRSLRINDRSQKELYPWLLDGFATRLVVHESLDLGEEMVIDDPGEAADDPTSWKHWPAIRLELTGGVHEIRVPPERAPGDVVVVLSVGVEWLPPKRALARRTVRGCCPLRRRPRPGERAGRRPPDRGKEGRARRGSGPGRRGPPRAPRARSVKEIRMAEQQHKRRIKNLLIDPQFQLKYVVLSVLVAALIFVVLGWLYVAEWEAGNRILREINPIVKKAAPDGRDAAELEDLEALTEGLPMHPQEQANLQALEEESERIIEDRGQEHLAWLTVSVGLLVVFLAGLVIWLTHRAAGPVHAFRSFIEATRAGAWDRIRAPRKGDEFGYFAEELVDFIEELKDRAAADIDRLDRCAAALDAGDADAVRELLATLKAEKADWLRGSRGAAKNKEEQGA